MQRFLTLAAFGWFFYVIHPAYVSPPKTVESIGPFASADECFLAWGNVHTQLADLGDISTRLTTCLDDGR